MNNFIPEFVFGDKANGQYHKIKTSIINNIYNIIHISGMRPMIRTAKI
jgi:hypothetical protein